MSRIDLGGGVVLALGGGGMRGVAHLGVLEELHAAGVRVRGIAGTSSGALLGALWLLEGEASVDRVRSFCSSGIARRLPDFGATGPQGVLARLRRNAGLVRVLLARHLLNAAALDEYVAFFLSDLSIEDLPVPFVAVATSSTTGEEVRIGAGPLRQAVAASSAMPGLAPPVIWQGRRLQDGGAVAEIPVGAAREIGGPVVAVEVSEALPEEHPSGSDRLHRAMFRAAAMGWQALRGRLLADADAVIAPAVNHFHWADYHAVDQAVEAGRIAARAFIAEQRFLQGDLRLTAN